MEAVVKAKEGAEARYIYFRRIGEQHWSIEEAIDIHRQLTEALHRVTDLTPIESDYVPAAPITPSRNPARSPKPSTDQLLDLI